MEKLSLLSNTEFLFQILANHWVMTLGLVGLVAIFVRLKKTLNATTRHNVWLVTLLFLIFMPMLVFVPRPDIDVPKLDLSFLQVEQVQTTSETSPKNIQASPSVNIVQQIPVGPNSTAIRIEENSFPVTKVTDKNIAPDTTAISNATTLSLSLVLKVLAIIWLTGIAVLLRRLWSEYRAARELELQSDSVTDYFARRFKLLCERLEVKEIPHLRFHAGINAPMTVGLYRVWVAIPMVWREGIDDDIFDQTLTHELGHIARKDPFVNTIQRFVEILLWMYPAVWYVTRQLELERESACDDWVLTHDGKSNKYASNLLDVAESLYLQPKVLAVGCLRSHSQLSRRIQNLLDKSSDHAIRNSGILLSAVAVGLFVTLSASAVMWPDATQLLSQNSVIEAEQGTSEVMSNEPGENFNLTGGTVVINGVEVNPSSSNPLNVPPAIPVTPNVIVNNNDGTHNYSDGENSYSYSHTINSSEFGNGSINFVREDGELKNIKLTPEINSDKQPLLHAAWNNDFEAMVEQLESGADVNKLFERQTMPRTALEAAILQGHKTFVKKLVKYGAELNNDSPMQRGENVQANSLTVAAMAGRKDIAQYLISKGARFSDEVMIVAIQSKDAEFVDFLIDEGIEVEDEAIVISVQNRDIAMTKLLLKKNDCGCLDLDTALMLAIQNRDDSMVELLLDAGADAEDGALVIAIQSRNKELVKRLIDAGADTDDGALIIAIQNRDEEIIDLLLDVGADPDDGALVIAVQNRDEKLVKRLIDADVDIDEGALIIAIQTRSSEMINLLLESGAEVDDGAMMIAKQTRNDEIIRLVSKHYDGEHNNESINLGDVVKTLGTVATGVIDIVVDASDYEEYENDVGSLSLLKAMEQHDIVLANNLIAKGVQPNTLHLLKALEQNESDLAYKFLDEGAKPDSLSLLKALENEDIDLATKFIHKGAKPNGLIMLKAQEIGDKGFLRLLSTTSPNMNTSSLDNIRKFSKKKNYKTDEQHRSAFSLTQWPVASQKVSLGFNDSAKQFTGHNDSHEAWDFPMPEGSDVKVVADGKVIESRYNDSFGYYIVVDHGNSYMTKYANNKINKVSKGERVNKGQVIALVGNDAPNSSGPHLHFEVKYRHVKIDPEIFLKTKT